MASKDAEGEDINIKELQGKQDKIRDLMRRDPKFIGRLIVVSSKHGRKPLTGQTCLA
jgi:hypothetical protein